MSDAESSQAVRTRYGVPEDVHLRVDRREVLAWLPAAGTAVRRVASSPDTLAQAGVSGRAPLGLVEDEHGSLLVRTYRKGGLLRHVRGRLFRGRWRPLAELVLHRRLLDADVPVPDAVGCVVLLRPLGWRGFLLVREVAQSLDLEAWLYGVPHAIEASPADVLRAAGRAVRRLHDAGVSHADLHPKNLLVTPDGDVLVLDLDKARTFERPLDDAERLTNLVRLARSIEKHRLKGIPAGRREALRFLQGYAGSQAGGAEWLERVRTGVGRGLALRMAWWRLSGEARPWSGHRRYARREEGSR